MLVHGFDGAGAQLAAQALDVHVHRAGLADALVAPGGAQQLLAGEGGIGGEHQGVQQRKFLRREGQMLAVQGGFAAVCVQLSVLPYWTGFADGTAFMHT